MNRRRVAPLKTESLCSQEMSALFVIASVLAVVRLSGLQWRRDLS